MAGLGGGLYWVDLVHVQGEPLELDLDTENFEPVPDVPAHVDAGRVVIAQMEDQDLLTRFFHRLSRMAADQTSLIEVYPLHEK